MTKYPVKAGLNAMADGAHRYVFHLTVDGAKYQFTVPKQASKEDLNTLVNQLARTAMSLTGLFLPEQLQPTGESVMNISIKDDDTVVIDGVTFVKQPAPIKQIDWSKMPKGIWVKVTMNPEDKWYRRQLGATRSSPTKYVTLDSSGDALGEWLHIRLIEQPEVTFWSGGECPVPEGVIVEVHYRCWESAELTTPNEHGWGHDGSPYDIIGYRILGVADGWKS